MRKISLLSTAAIVLLGAGVATAQSPKKEEGAGRTPTVQQNAPAEKTAPSMRAGERKGPETTGQSSHEGASGTSNGRASQELKPDTDKRSGSKSTETTGQSPKEGDQDKRDSGMKKSSDTNKERDSGSSATMKNESDMNKGSDTKTQNNAQGAPSTRSNESATDRTTTERTTTGQGAAAGSVKLSSEQRTKITTVIKQQKVEPTRLNVSVRVGTRVPDSVRFHPLPVEVVNVYPEWRGYDYILVDEQIVVLDPRTHEIIAILEA